MFSMLIMDFVFDVVIEFLVFHPSCHWMPLLDVDALDELDEFDLYRCVLEMCI